MRLLTRLVVTIAVTITLGLAAIFGAATVILMGEFRQAEARQVDTGMDGLRDNVERDLDGLGTSAAALGQIMLSLFATAPANNSTTQTDNSTALLAFALFSAHRLDALFLMVDAGANGSALGFGEGRAAGYALGGGANGLSDAPAHLNITVQTLPTPAFPLIGGGWGLVASGGETWMLGGAPLSLSGLPAEFVPGGAALPDLTIVTARRLDDADLRGLQASADQPVRLEPATMAHQAWGDDTHIERHDKDSLTARIALAGLDGRPAGVLASPQDRPIFSQGVDAIVYFYLAVVFISIIVLVAGLVFLNRGVVRPIQGLGRRMRDLRLGHATAPPPTPRDDETGDLAREFEMLLSRLEERQHQLTRSNEDLSRYASVVNHDLKGPLSTLRVSLGALKARLGKKAGPEETKTIARLEKGMEDMAQRIDAVLAYSKIRFSPPTLAPTPLDEVLKQVQADLAADIKRTGARIDVGLLPTVQGDRAQLTVLFQNLLANALKFHKPGQAPVVHISARPAGNGRAEVSVADEGLGFDSSKAQALFKPFGRLGNASGIDGQGIGLATCARICEMGGGSIRAEGTEGIGARFVATLPLAKALPAVAAAPMRR